MDASVAHGTQQFVIVRGAFHTVSDKFHRLDAVTVAQETAQNPHAVKRFGAQQQVVTTRARCHDVNSRAYTLVAEFAVKLKLHIACPLELLEYDFVHLRAGLGKSGSDNGQ